MPPTLLESSFPTQKRNIFVLFKPHLNMSILCFMFSTHFPLRKSDFSVFVSFMALRGVLLDNYPDQ